MKKATLVGMFALLLLGIVATSAFASNSRGLSREGNDQMRAAMETGDHDEYVEAFGENDKAFMRHKLSEEKFNERTERRTEMQQHREEIEAAIDAGDYDAWKALIESSPKADRFSVIDEDNFNLLREMHELKEAGDFQGAEAIAEELGLERMGLGGGNAGLGNAEGNMHKGMHKGNCLAE